MKLKKNQKELVLQWIAEGLRTNEINERAALQAPVFQVTRHQVDFYRRTRKVKLDRIRDLGEDQAIIAGYHTAATRVEKLAYLAALLEDDLFNGQLWLQRARGIGPASKYEKIIEEEFNAAEVAQYRATLDDIARETGGRVQKIQTEVEVDLIWDLPVPGFTPPGPAGAATEELPAS